MLLPGWNSGLSNGKCGFNVQKIQHEIPLSYCLFCNFGTGPCGTRDGKILPDLGTQRRLGTACSSALARWALDLIQGEIYSSADTLFSTCFGHGTQQCPNFRDWNRLKSSSSWYASKNEDHWVGDLSPEQLWGGGKYSAGQERRLKNGWKYFFLLWTLCISIILYHSLSDLQNRDTNIRSDSMTGGFNRWPRAIDATGTAELW